MNDSADSPLYDLLPAIYQIEDAKRGDPLKHLLSIVSTQYEILTEDMNNLYDNWFIETCDDWVIPYIGDLVSAVNLSHKPSSQHNGRFNPRAYVANTLAYRRRKGTAPVLEQVIKDVTGWHIRVVEFWQLLALSQHLDHLRPKRTTVNLSSPSLQDRTLSSPFEKELAYSVAIREKYHPAYLGIFIWRLQTYPIVKVTARSVAVAGLEEGRCFRLSPLNQDLALFNPPMTETEITQQAEEIHLPSSLPNNRPHPAYQKMAPPWQIWLNGQPKPLLWEQIAIGTIDKDTWQLKGFDQNFNLNCQDKEYYSQYNQQKVVVVDPELGRCVFLKESPTSVESSYTYAFSGDIGGGLYGRTDGITSVSSLNSGLFWTVDRENSAEANPLAGAIARWNQTVTAWQACLEQKALMLTQVTLSSTPTSRQAIPQHLQPLRPIFQSGVISGLEVIAEEGTKEIIITLGNAIDSQGRIINLDRTLSLPIESKSATYLLVIAHAAANSTITGDPFCQLIPFNQSDSYSDKIYLRLLKVKTENGQIIRVDEEVRSSFKAGIVQGFNVFIPRDRLEAILSPGTAINPQGQRLVLDRNIAIDLRPYQGQRIALLLPYHARFSQRNWQPTVIAADDLDQYAAQSYFLLTILDVPTVRIESIKIKDNSLETTNPMVKRGSISEQNASKPKNPSLRPNFKPGIIQGLKLQGEKEGFRVTVTEGCAINAAGQRISLKFPYHLRRLWRYRQKDVTLAIGCSGRQTEVKVFSEGTIPENYLKLATFSINPQGRLSKCPDTSIASWFEPGIITGLAVTKQTDNHWEYLVISAGKAVNSDGKLLDLNQDCAINLQRYVGKKFVLFLGEQRNQGWQPLDVTKQVDDPVSQKLGIMPPLPTTESEKIGTILLKDNQTYQGDLDIIIPADRTLNIVAVNGCRPHLWGNLTIQGTGEDQTTIETRNNPEPGELKLDGFLIEGRLIVKAGNLKSLQLSHCTLVPSPEASLIVEPSWAEQAENNAQNSEGKEEEDRWLLIAMALYWLQLFRQILKLSFNLQLPPQQRLQQLSELALTGVHHFWENLCQAVRQLPPIDFCSPETGEGMNLELDITLDRCICGSIYLSRHVLRLTIQNSIVDKGIENALSSIAISAIGTQVAVQQSTILGSTFARSIEGKDSIFEEIVTVLDRQRGCLQFCYIPDGSLVPALSNCQPNLTLKRDLPILPSAVTAIAESQDWLFCGTAGQGLYFAPTLQTIVAIFLEIWTITLLLFNQSRLHWFFSQCEFSQRVWQLYQKVHLADKIQKQSTSLLDQRWQQESTLKNTYITTLYVSSQNESIWAGTLEGKILKFDSSEQTWRERPIDPPKVAINALIIYQNYLFVGTAGEGVWMYASEGDRWILLSQTLKSTGITAFTIDANDNLWVGTDGEGIFCFLPQQQSWQSANRGLTHRHITALTHEESVLFTGTKGGGVFFSDDNGLSWTDMAKIYVNSDFIPYPYVTALLVDTQDGQGRLSSKDKRVTLTYPEDVDENEKEVLNIGDFILVNHQTRLITNINIDKEQEKAQDKNQEFVEINEAFCPSLTAVPYQIRRLVVGTAGGGIDNRRHLLNSNGNARYITALTRTMTGEILAGTIYGGLWRSQDEGQTWEGVNEGLTPNIERKLRILTQLQPSFVSRRYEESAYAQLSQTCPDEILRGAEEGSEMGVFSFLAQPQRQDNLQASLKEYVRFGLDTQIFYMT